MKKIKIYLIALAVVSFLAYSIIGTSGNVDTIKKLAPSEMLKRNWRILRYEGFQHGSWANHGGKVWYHVACIDNSDIQYRVCITLWGDELQYYYGQPEVLNRVKIDY